MTAEYPNFPADESVGTFEPWEIVVPDLHLLWAETLSLARDGFLYITANQLQLQSRHHEGQDLRRKPYALFRTPVTAQPALLR